MRACSRTLAALVAALALSVATTATATAIRFRASSTQLRLTFPEWTVDVGFEFRVTCPLTLEGALHASTFGKAFRALLGSITSAAVGSCTGGRLAMLTATMPWHVRYEGFAGVLPNIATIGLRLAGMAFQARLLEAFDCLYVASEPARWFLARERAGAITSVRWAENIPVSQTSGFCAIEGFVSGTGSLTQTGTETPLAITLV